MADRYRVTVSGRRSCIFNETRGYIIAKTLGGTNVEHEQLEAIVAAANAGTDPVWQQVGDAGAPILARATALLAHQLHHLKEELRAVLEYAERFADLNDEPEAGGCRSTIEHAQGMLAMLSPEGPPVDSPAMAAALDAVEAAGAVQE